jgi:CRP-like cAMP-binding protein
MDILRKNILFSGLSDEQFALVVTNSKIVQLKEGEVLFRQQQPAKYFYFLDTGDIKLYRLSPEGAEKVIELIRAGQTFAEAVMFMHGSFYPVNAQALADSQLIKIEMMTFRSLLEHSSETSLKILGHMSRRLHGLVQEIEELTLQNAKMRVIQFLLRELPVNAVSPYQLQWNMPKTVLASRLSIRPETFSRILQQLAQEHLIKVEGRKIEILNIDKLKYPEL